MRARRWLPALLLAAAVTPAFADAPVIRTLPNGLQVAVFRDTRTPLVQVQALVPGGTMQETSREHGAASLVAWLITRGSNSRTAAELNSEMEALGGTISSNATTDYATLSAAFRSADLEPGMELVADALLNPIFQDDEVGHSRGEALSTLFQSRRLPDVVADEHIWGTVFRSHPAGVPLLGTVESVASLSRDDLQRFHRECYRPGGSLLAISGDVDPERAFAAANEYFGAWKGTARTIQVPAPQPPEPDQVRLVDLPGLKAAEIRIGLPVPGTGSADVAALAVANEVLGGVGGSRLSAVARAYGARSTLRLLRDSGLLLISASAPADSTAQVVARLKSELARFTKQPPSDAEVKAAARTLGRAFQLANESTASQAGQWLGARFHGLGDDYGERYPERLQAVTAADVRAVATKWMQENRAALVVVGPASVLESKLRTFGTVQVVPVTAAPTNLEAAPAMRMTAPTAEELSRGRKLIDQAVTAHGGTTKLKGVKDITTEADVTLYSGARTISGTQREIKRDPWQMRLETTFTALSTVQALDGDQAWMRVDAPRDSTADMDSLGVVGLRGLFLTDPLHMLLIASSSSARAAYRGDDVLGDRPVNVVEIVAGSGRWVVFLDSASHSLAGMEENAGSALAGPSLRRVYGDLRPEQGILWPHIEDRLLDGERTIALRVRNVRFNTGVTAAAFARPQSKSAPRARGR
jgi:zinc protease